MQLNDIVEKYISHLWCNIYVQTAVTRPVTKFKRISLIQRKLLFKIEEFCKSLISSHRFFCLSIHRPYFYQNIRADYVQCLIYTCKSTDWFVVYIWYAYTIMKQSPFIVFVHKWTICHLFLWNCEPDSTLIFLCMGGVTSSTLCDKDVILQT